MSDIFLSRIGIHDFRTFGAFEIELPAAPGLVLLTGTNGLGKSSFFDAIEWGLTNTIRRFEPYVQKGKTKFAEKDYLTRRGAEPGSHRVSLTFSGGEPIERAAGSGTATADIVAQLARPDRRAINDLGTYLALTHFLGQAAQQRFTSRDPWDQWQSLKGPSGIDRLERVRAGLRGRPTVTAFNRRIETQQTVVTTLERQIADWQGWLTRLERLHTAARAKGILTAAEVTERIEQLETELLHLMAGQLPAITDENIGRRLVGLGDRIGDALRSKGERKAALESMAALAAQYAISRTESRLDTPVLIRLRGEVSDAQARLERAFPLVSTANDAVSAQQAALATIEQNIQVLEAGRADLARRQQLRVLIATDNADRKALVDAIAAHRKAIETANNAIGNYTEVMAEVARLRSLAASARALDESMADYLDLEAGSVKAAAALAHGRDVAARVTAQLVPLEIQLSGVDRRVGNAERDRAEADRHATAISAALSQLASHLHAEDTDCPVCTTSFAPGVLKALADAAAAGNDARLAKASEALEALRVTRSALTRKIDALKAQVAAVDELVRAADTAARAASDARATIAHSLRVPADSDLATLAARRRRDAETALATAEETLDPLTASAAAASEQRSSMANNLEELIVRESRLGARLAQFQSEDTACADRISARNLSNATLSDIEARLTSARGQAEAARARFSKLVDAANAAVAASQRDQAAVDTASAALTAGEATRAAAEQSA